MIYNLSLESDTKRVFHLIVFAVLSYIHEPVSGKREEQFPCKNEWLFSGQHGTNSEMF